MQRFSIKSRRIQVSLNSLILDKILGTYILVGTDKNILLSINCPVGGLPLCVIASVAKQSRHEVIEIFCLDCFVVPPRNDVSRLFFGRFFVFLSMESIF